jgi:hypothetical protein
VRSALLLPLVVLFVFVPLFLFFSAVDFLAFWGARHAEAAAAVRAQVLLRVPVSLKQALPIAVFCTLGLLILGVKRDAGSPFLPFFLIMGSALLLLILGYGLVIRMAAESPRLQESALTGTGPSPAGFLLAGRINRPGGVPVYVESVAEMEAEHLVVAQEGDPQAVLRYYPRVAVTRSDGALLLRPSKDRPPIVAAEPVYADLFRLSPREEGLAADVRVLNEELDLLYRRGGSGFALLCFSFVFFLTAAFFLLRTSRWPLMGALLGFLLLRGLLYLFGAFRRGVVVELQKLSPLSSWIALLPAALLLLGGTLFLMFGLLRVQSAPARKRPGHG